MPKFEKGNPKIPSSGRKKGSLNKKTTETIKTIEYVLGLLDEHMESDIALLKPAERTKMWEILQEYRSPKLARTENKLELPKGSSMTTILFTEQERKDDTRKETDSSI